MKFAVSGCCSGSRFFFRVEQITTRHRVRVGRFEVPGDTWNRKTAGAVLDILVRHFGLKRKSIRFEV